MKYILILLLFASCKKPEPETIVISIYASTIQHANYNEPKTLYWHIVDEGNEVYYIATNTDLSRSVESLEFERWKGFPADIYKYGRFIRTITVNKNLIYRK